MRSRKLKQQEVKVNKKASIAMVLKLKLMTSLEKQNLMTRKENRWHHRTKPLKRSQMSTTVKKMLKRAAKMNSKKRVKPNFKRAHRKKMMRKA